MDKMRDELEKLRTTLDVQGPKLTDEARADLAEQTDAKSTAIQRFSRILRKK